jgi:hypothetical protein
MEVMEPQPSFEVFRPSKVQVSVSRPTLVEGFPFEFEMENKLV